jgi:hypothetical protein
MFRAGMAALMLASALALAGCGSSGTTSSSSTTALSQPAYQAKLRAENAKVTVATKALQAALRSGHATPTSAGKAINAYSGVQRQIGDELASLDPPADAQTANADLAKGFQDSADESAQLADQVAGAKSQAQAVAILKKFGESSAGGKEIDQALTELHKLGYKKLD